MFWLRKALWTALLLNKKKPNNPGLNTYKLHIIDLDNLTYPEKGGEKF